MREELHHAAYAIYSSPGAGHASPPTVNFLPCLLSWQQQHEKRQAEKAQSEAGLVWSPPGLPKLELPLLCHSCSTYKFYQHFSLSLPALIYTLYRQEQKDSYILHCSSLLKAGQTYPLYISSLLSPSLRTGRKEEGLHVTSSFYQAGDLPAIPFHHHLFPLYLPLPVTAFSTPLPSPGRAACH